MGAHYWPDVAGWLRFYEKLVKPISVLECFQILDEYNVAPSKLFTHLVYKHADNLTLKKFTWRTESNSNFTWTLVII
jgi:hypothetical protein